MELENRVLRRIFGSNKRLEKFHNENFLIRTLHHILFGRQNQEE
jgi:hypothetical protein